MGRAMRNHVPPMIPTSVVARRNVRHISTRCCMKRCSCVGWIASMAGEDFLKNLNRNSGLNIWLACELLVALTITPAQSQITVDGIRNRLNRRLRGAHRWHGK